MFDLKERRFWRTYKKDR